MLSTCSFTLSPSNIFGPACCRYFRRSKLLYTDYYWKTTHRVTTRFIMRCEKRQTRWLVDFVVLLVLLSFLVLGWHHYPIILQPYDYMMSEENVDTYVSCSLIVCIYQQAFPSWVRVRVSASTSTRRKVCPLSCPMRTQSTINHKTSTILVLSQSKYRGKSV